MMSHSMHPFLPSTARFDKANSQYAASKEMMRVAELQLGAREVDMASPLNQAWQEMLNHATEKVRAESTAAKYMYSRACY